MRHGDVERVAGVVRGAPDAADELELRRVAGRHQPRVHRRRVDRERGGEGQQGGERRGPRRFRHESRCGASILSEVVTSDFRLARAALLLSLALAWLNFLLTSRWASIPGSVHGPKRWFYVAALVLASVLALLPARGYAETRRDRVDLGRIHHTSRGIAAKSARGRSRTRAPAVGCASPARLERARQPLCGRPSALQAALERRALAAL